MEPVDPLMKVKMMTDEPFLQFYMKKLTLKKNMISPLFGEQKDLLKSGIVLGPLQILKKEERAKVEEIGLHHKKAFHYLAISKIKKENEAKRLKASKRILTIEQ